MTQAPSEHDPHNADSVRIVPHDPAWAEEYAREAVRLREALGAVAVAIEHVGSTSVPGLAAKPIVDIQIAVRAIEPMAPYRGPLEVLGYLFRFDPEMPDYHFFAKPAARPRRYHIHVCDAGSLHERRHLAVRDYLRAHPAEAAAYAGVKRRAAEQHPGDRDGYVTAKDQYMKELELRALVWAEAAGRTSAG